MVQDAAPDAAAAVAGAANSMATQVGIGFREPLKADIFLRRSEFDVLEITADHYINAGEKKLAELDILREHFPLIPHSLDLSLGSAEGVNEEYLEKLAEVIERVGPRWFSDHICFTRAGCTRIGHLAPVPFTDEALKVFVKNITHVKKRIATPLILENITYMMKFPSSEMTEAEFITRLLNETDCGLLLDVTNLYINSRNFDFDWRKFLDDIPMERIVQLHFVGSQRHGTRLIDAHADKTENDIWTVFKEVCRLAEVKAAILERDENFPVFDEIVEEMRTARNMAGK